MHNHSRCSQYQHIHLLYVVAKPSALFIHSTLSNHCTSHAFGLHCSHTQPVTLRFQWCMCVLKSACVWMLIIFPNKRALASRLPYTATRRNRTVELCFWYNIDVVAPLVWIYNNFKEKGTYSKLQSRKKNISKKKKSQEKKISWKKLTHARHLAKQLEKKYLNKKKKFKQKIRSERVQ